MAATRPYAAKPQSPGWQILGEEFFHFAEDAAGGGFVFHLQRIAERSDEVALRFGKPLGGFDDDLDNQVAATMFVQEWDTFAAQTKLFAALRTFSNAHARLAFKCGHVNLGTEGDLGK